MVSIFCPSVIYLFKYCILYWILPSLSCHHFQNTLGFPTGIPVYVYVCARFAIASNTFPSVKCHVNEAKQSSTASDTNMNIKCDTILRSYWSVASLSPLLYISLDCMAFECGVAGWLVLCSLLFEHERLVQSLREILNELWVLVPLCRYANFWIIIYQWLLSCRNCIRIRPTMKIMNGVRSGQIDRPLLLVTQANGGPWLSELENLSTADWLAGWCRD